MCSTDVSTLASQTTQAVSSSQSEPLATPIIQRPRRLRRTETLRWMVRENTLRIEDLIYPLFVVEGEGQREEVPSIPDCYRYTLDLLLDEVKEAYGLGIGAIALFPLIPYDQKDNNGTESYNPNGLISRAVRTIKQAIPNILISPMLPSTPTAAKGMMALCRMAKSSMMKTNLPIAAYNVSGEYAMIKAAAARGWINEKKVILETLTSMKRAGADLILTYFAKDVALILP